MKRRQFIALGGATALAPLAARAQQPRRIYRLGCLVPSGRQTPPIVAFFDELKLHGFAEGQNLEVVPGGFDIRNERVAQVAAVMVKATPDVIYSGGVVASRAVQAATKTVPIIAASQDLVADKLVASLARPGGNITGVSFLAHLLDGKRLELLTEAAPAARRMAILADPSTSTPQHLQMLQNAASARGVELSVYVVASPEEIVPTLDRAKAWGAGAINVLSSPLFNAYPNRGVVVARTAALQLPAIYEWPEIAEEGGFAAYGPRFSSIFQQLARLTVKVLRGAKPADIPAEQPTNFELVINLRTAKAIGHEVPASLVLRADKVIE